MTDEPSFQSDSIKNLFQGLRDFADELRTFEIRVRVLEEKRYEAEGALKNLLDRTELQIGRLTAQEQDNKLTRSSVAQDLKAELAKVDQRFTLTNEKLDRINLKIAYWSGGIAVLLVLVQLLLKFWK